MTLDLATRQRKQAAQRELRAITKHENKARKAKRPPNQKATRGRVREPLYLAFIRRQPCAAAGLGGCDGPVEAAHVRYSDRGRINPGLQVKPSDEYTLPLCASHHRTGPHAQHSMNERAFYAMIGIDPVILMAYYRSAYQRER